MKLAHVLVVCLAVSAAPAALAQKWELGGGASGAFNTSQEAKLPSGTATAKIAPGFGLGVWVTNNTSARWGGEIRYLYQNGELRVEQSSIKATMSGDSHSLLYDFHWHTADAGSRVRPYIAFGAGVKMFRGTGTEVPVQPLRQFVLLTKTTELQGMGSIGIGIKAKLSPHWQFRVDVHDYITRFPKDVFQPNVGVQMGDWLHNIVPMVGLTWTY
jgi:outer membrane protein W